MCGKTSPSVSNSCLPTWKTLALDHYVPSLPLGGERREKNTAIALKEHGHKDPTSYLDINNHNRSFTREDSSGSCVHHLLTRTGVSANSKSAGMSEAHPGRKKRPKLIPKLIIKI